MRHFPTHRPLITFALTALVSACAGAPPAQPPGPPSPDAPEIAAALDGIKGAAIKEHMSVLADDALEGRRHRFDELFATSLRIDRNDPEWKQRAEQRRWMRYWPGVLST
jgi:hypothetical protein